MSDLFLTAPIWSLFIFSLIPLTLKVCNKNKEISVFFSATWAWVGIATSIACLLPLLNKTTSLFSGALELSPLRVGASLILLTVFSLVILMSLRHPQTNEKTFSEILFLKMGAFAGLLILLWAGNLLTAFIGLEIASLVFYLLIALGRTGPFALKAAFKYFVLGSTASAFLLYGLCFVFGSTGNFDLQTVFQKTPELISHSRLFAIALIFVFAGFLFKISIFPFQFWLADVYQGSFTSLLVLMAVGLKVAIFVLLFEWTKNIFISVNMPSFVAFFQWLAVLSVLFGNIIALLQKDFKKMLLFSTIAHSGYLLMILTASQMNFALSQTALLYYLTVYAGMTTGVFMCLRPFEKTNSAELPLEKLKGLSEKKPLYSALIALLLFSLAGLPPTGGFIAKLFVFQAVLDQGFWWMLFWTIIGSSIALFYYLKPIALMYMKQGVKEDTFSFPRFLVPALVLIATFVLLSGVLPSLFYFG